MNPGIILIVHFAMMLFLSARAANVFQIHDDERRGKLILAMTFLSWAALHATETLNETL